MRRTKDFTKTPQVLFIKFYGFVEEEDIDLLIGENVSGFSAECFFEDENGEKVEVESQPEHVQQNRVFVDWINIIFLATSVEDVSFKIIWKLTKELRLRMINTEGDQLLKTGCEVFISDIILERYMKKFEESLGLNYSKTQEQVLESQITDGILQVGADTFLYFSNCPGKNTFKG